MTKGEQLLAREAEVNALRLRNAELEREIALHDQAVLVKQVEELTLVERTQAQLNYVGLIRRRIEKLMDAHDIPAALLLMKTIGD